MDYFVVKTTNMGEILCPDKKPDAEIRYWADVLGDRMRVNEIYGLLEAFREDIYERAELNAWVNFNTGGGERSLAPGSAMDQADGTGTPSDSGEVQGLPECSCSCSSCK